MKQLLIIVSAPSGGGKSTLCQKALREYPQLVHSISYTTRAPRPEEKGQAPYNYISDEKFRELIDQDYFAEWAKVHAHYYGTARNQLEAAWKKGQYVIMDIDVQGAASLKAQYQDAVSIFVLPPSIEALRQRIVNRNGGKEPKDLELRLENAKMEMAEAKKFDYQIINEDLDQAYRDFKKVIENLME
jgi:guanylate kinase